MTDRPDRWKVILTFEVEVIADRATEALTEAREAIKQGRGTVMDFGAKRLPDVASRSGG